MKQRKPTEQHARLSQTRTAPHLTRWQRVWMMRQSLAILAPTLCLVCITAYLMYARMRYMDNELAGAPTYSGAAVVTRKYVSSNSGRNTNFRMSVALQFRINGHTTNIDAPLNAKSGLTNVGQTVTLTYRIGKSGDYYGVDWQPSGTLPR